MANYQPLGLPCPGEPAELQAYCIAKRDTACCRDPCGLIPLSSNGNNELNYARLLHELAKQVLQVDTHFLIDTSRNGVDDAREAPPPRSYPLPSTTSLLPSVMPPHFPALFAVPPISPRPRSAWLHFTPSFPLDHSPYSALSLHSLPCPTFLNPPTYGLILSQRTAPTGATYGARERGLAPPARLLCHPWWMPTTGSRHPASPTAAHWSCLREDSVPALTRCAPRSTQ